MKRPYTATEAHLDAALAVPWSMSTCLLAKATGHPYPRADQLDDVGMELRMQFDRAHLTRKASYIAALRARLPVTFLFGEE